MMLAAPPVMVATPLRSGLITGLLLCQSLSTLSSISIVETVDMQGRGNKADLRDICLNS